MKSSKNKFTLKIILSYLLLGSLFVFAAIFLYSEIENLIPNKNDTAEGKKIIETGTLINLLYETDGFYRLALLNEKDSDFEKYMSKSDSLFKKIEEVKSLSINSFQSKQLDSVKVLLEEKNKNIDQLRILRLTNNKDTSLDDILTEVKKLEISIGKNTVESMVRNPSKLSSRDRQVWESYADYLNQELNTTTVKSKTVDSMLIAARYIVAEAKKENSRIRKSLAEKENELIRNDLEISAQLREIISSFDAEIVRKNNMEREQQEQTISRAGDIFKLSGILGGIVILLFSYFILSDFFKAERFKKNLEKEKNYSEALLKSRGQLISTVSHDLKTPLNTITGYSELFQNSNLSEKQNYYLQQITSSSYFISHLVDDLLDYSKLEAGKLPMENLPFSLDNIIMESANAANQLHIHKSVDLIISIPENIKNSYFESDPLRIRQIINNLVGNAFKFTDNGKVEIRVQEIERYNHTSLIEIKVIDTGIGIPFEKLESIFEEFIQAEDDTSHKFGGSGLGLAISKKLTGLLKGTLKAGSEIGKGSVFTLRLPLKISEKIRTKEVLKRKSISTNLKALIIDDDEAMRSLLQEMFKESGINSETYPSFRNFKAANIVPPDFLLTDIQMPGFDGFTILEKLKNGEANWSSEKPVIAMTGNREHSRSYYLEKGFAEVLFKPFSKAELMHILGELFSLEFSETNVLDIDSTKNEPTEEYDLSLLNSFLTSDEALGEVLRVFHLENKKDILKLKEAISEKDYKSINAISHRMLTMFRQLKAKKIIPTLEKMEDYINKTPDISIMQKDLSFLKDNILNLQSSLQNKGFYKSMS